MTIRVGFLTTHPIQYQAPIFRLLADVPGIELTVLFGMLPDRRQQGVGFAVEFEWDVPLLDGYRFEVLDNVASSPGVTTFGGCDTPRITDVLRQLQLDVLIVNGWVVKSCLQGVRACRRLGIPCLVRGEANGLRARPWWKRAAHRQLLKAFSGFLCIGRANRAFYRSHGIGDEKLFWAPYCVDNERFRSAGGDPPPSGDSRPPLAEHRPSLRSRWGIPEGGPCFLFCGKFEAKKHPVELVRAFRNAWEKGMSANLLMVGDGELRRECESIAREFSLPVRFTGFLNQSEIVDAYSACDCVVLPSDHGETWGLVVNEAMACGRPALVSDQVGCAADLIVPGVTGEVFRFGDWQELSERLMAMAADPVLLGAMGEQAARHIDGYSPAAAVAGIVEAVRCVAPALTQRAPRETAFAIDTVWHRGAVHRA
jgi:glycosyltransferase involved in cell wall biosynthesis